MTQAIILAAGESSRFRPLSEGRHKSLLKLMGKTLIEHTVDSAIQGGAKEAIIVVSPSDEKSFSSIFKTAFKKSQQKPNIKIVVQPEPRGMGNALLCASSLVKDDFFVINAADKFNAHEHMKKMIAKQKKTKVLPQPADAVNQNKRNTSSI